MYLLLWKFWHVIMQIVFMKTKSCIFAWTLMTATERVVHHRLFHCTSMGCVCLMSPEFMLKWICHVWNEVFCVDFLEFTSKFQLNVIYYLFRYWYQRTNVKGSDTPSHLGVSDICWSASGGAPSHKVCFRKTLCCTVCSGSLGGQTVQKRGCGLLI